MNRTAIFCAAVWMLGMVALTVSTGIEHRWMGDKICDRFSALPWIVC